MVLVSVSGFTATGSVSGTGAANLGFTLVTSALKNTSADIVAVFIANSLCASAAASTVTWATGAGNATGACVSVIAVSSMSRAGSAAVKQSAVQANRAAATTPAPVFGASCLTGNPTVGIVGNSTNPAGMTPPTGWTESGSPVADIGYNTPASGSEVVSRDSGFTGTTVTWGSASASANGVVVVELDASATGQGSDGEGWWSGASASMGTLAANVMAGAALCGALLGGQVAQAPQDEPPPQAPVEQDEDYWQNPVGPTWYEAPRVAVEQWRWDEQEAVPVPLVVQAPGWGLLLPSVVSAVPLPWRWDDGNAPMAAPAAMVDDEAAAPLIVWPATAPAPPWWVDDDLPPGAHEDDCWAPPLQGLWLLPPVAAPTDDGTGLPQIQGDEDSRAVFPAPALWPVPAAVVALEDEWVASPAATLAEDDAGYQPPIPSLGAVPWLPLWGVDGSDVPVPTAASLVGDEPWTVQVPPVWGYPAPAVGTDDGDLPIAPPTTARDEDAWTSGVAAVWRWPVPWVATDDGDLPVPTAASLVGDEPWVQLVASSWGWPVPRAATEDGDLPITPPSTTRDEDAWQNPVGPVWAWPVPWVATEDGDLPVPTAASLVGDEPGPRLVAPVAAAYTVPAPWIWDQPDLPLLSVDEEAWQPRPMLLPVPAIPAAVDDAYAPPLPLRDDDTGWINPVQIVTVYRQPALWLFDGDARPNPATLLVLDATDASLPVYHLADATVPSLALTDATGSVLALTNATQPVYSLTDASLPMQALTKADP